MWCDNCQADRAAEANAESQEVVCATCGARLTSQQFGKLDRQMQKARELLERWSKEPLLEPYSPLPDKHASHLPELRDDETSKSDVEPVSASLLEPVDEESNAEFASMSNQIQEIFNKSRQAKIRYDLAHGEDPENLSPNTGEDTDSKNQPPASEPVESPEQAAPQTTPPAEVANEEPQRSEPVAEAPPSMAAVPPSEQTSVSKVLRTDPPPRQTAPATHLNIQQLIEERLEHKPRKINWMMMVGQWLAYLGVLAMTAGAAVIVFGYFGGEAGMTPRGWMLTTAGQMLLFLGIVTLISSGMERSSEEITDRIDLLGEQLIRLEAVTREHFVPGPKISSERYAEDAESPHSEAVEEDAEQRV